MQRIIIRALLWVLAGYLLLLLLLFIFQRSFLYFPIEGPTDPKQTGLLGFRAEHFEARDGTNILYWESEAHDPTLPTLLYFHGNGGGLHYFVPYLQALHKKGVRIAAMEYRGYPGVAGSPSQNHIVSDAVQFMQHMHETRPQSPLILWGYSLGSGIATQAAAKLQDVDIQHLILEAPFTSVVERAGEMMPWVPTRLLLRDRYDSASVIKQVTAPVTIIHGTHDPLIPFAHGQRLFQQANHPKTLITVEGADHWNLLAHGAYDRVVMLPPDRP
jgi:pimeloyl-ACP methyl ester carboxylesterase